MCLPPNLPIKQNPTSSFSFALVLVFSRLCLRYEVVTVMSVRLPVVCFLFVCNVCIVTKRYVLLKNCLKKQTWFPGRYLVLPVWRIFIFQNGGNNFIEVLALRIAY